ncbi:MAG: 23S rRNA (pseudouridine(1915)-N(3))-methyltransferase RlmH [Bacteroidales bacterium]|nr:23S rRNA (pseudouridine(1915)-N(3))-methyltransferase RlmH [Bacteroidales bacterium]
MKITLLTIGKSAFPFVKEGLAMYEKRIARYTTYERIEIPALSGTSSLSSTEVKEKEGELILKKIKPSDEVILLDERGRSYSSIEWAHFLEKRLNNSTKSIVFVIGGAYGFSEKVYQAATSKLSLSDMTFSHQIIRLFFTEQLYRAFTIIKGEPYHNE